MRANKAMQLTGRRIEPVPDWGGRRAVRGTFTGGRQLIAGPLGSAKRSQLARLRTATSLRRRDPSRSRSTSRS